MRHGRVAAALVLGFAGVLAAALGISLIVTVAAFRIPGLAASSALLYFVAAATLVLSLSVHVLVDRIVFKRWTSVANWVPAEPRLGLVNSSVAYLSIGVSMFVAFYFRDVVVDIFPPAAADPRVAVSWMLATVFLIRIFLLIAASNEKRDRAATDPRGSGPQ